MTSSGASLIQLAIQMSTNLERRLSIKNLVNFTKTLDRYNCSKYVIAD